MLLRVTHRRRSFPMPLVLACGLGGCGPSVAVDGGDTDGAGGGEGSPSAPGDDTGAPARLCGEDDTEIIGGGPPGPLEFPPGCIPNADPGINGYRCCSDDPAAATGAPPAYEGMDIFGGSTPLFSGHNNDLSRSGQCIRVEDVADQGLLEPAASGCPIPCNPTWSSELIVEVCGGGRQCCQTRELQPSDCINDPSAGGWRPVTGDDIIAGFTTWTPQMHATHQDPNGVGCLQLAGGVTESEAYIDCVRALTVADQRGFCMALGAAQSCPHEQPDYVDACERLNEG